MNSPAPIPPSPSGPSTGQPAGPAERQYHGVVIEDDPSTLEFLEDMLTLWGYGVEIYPDPADALQGLILRPEIPDFIISDLRFIGGMDGFELITNLRAVHPKHFIPAILITGDTNPQHVLTATERKVHLLRKPMRPSYLQALLQKVCVAPPEAAASTVSP